MSKRILVSVCLILSLVMLLCAGNAEGRLFSALQDEHEHTFDMFEVQKLVMDENHKVTAVMGQYERAMVDADGVDVPEMAEEPLAHTYRLAEDVGLELYTDPMDLEEKPTLVTDLYAWYVATYLEGEEPENGELVYTVDLPAGDFETRADFWGIVTKITLNDQGEICYMTNVYTPWN